MFSLKKDYNYWLKTFFEGTTLIRGWNAVASEVVAAVPDNMKSEISGRMKRLGEQIAPVWASDNADRKISSSHLKEWGTRLQRAQREGPEPLVATLNDIEMEVNRLLETS